jgi:hypothetical protein
MAVRHCVRLDHGESSVASHAFVLFKFGAKVEKMRLAAAII